MSQSRTQEWPRTKRSHPAESRVPAKPTNSAENSSYRPGEPVKVTTARYFAEFHAKRNAQRCNTMREAQQAISDYLVGRVAIYCPLGDNQLTAFVSVLDSLADIPADVLANGGEYTSAGDAVVNSAEAAGHVWRGDHALSGDPDDEGPCVAFLELSSETAAVVSPENRARFPAVVIFPAAPGLPTTELAELFHTAGLNIDDFDPPPAPLDWDTAVINELTGDPECWEQWLAPTTTPTTGSDEVTAAADEIDPDDLRAINLVDWRAEMVDGPRPVEWLVPLILARGLLYQLVGAPKTGKSMVMLWLLWRLVTGQDPMPGAVAAEGDSTPSGPLRVLVIDKENSPRRLADRLTEFGADPDTLDNLHYASFPTFAPLDTARGAKQVVDLALHLEVDLVVLDTVSRFVSGNENNSQTYLDLYRHLLAVLKSHGITVVRIDHTGKDPSLGARGSSAKGGDVDVSWILTKGQTPQRLKLVREYDRTNDHPDVVHIRRSQSPLRHEMVTGRITLSDLADDARPDADALTESQRELVRQLDTLTVPETDSREAVRARLKDADIRATNVDLGAAIVHRRARRAADDAEAAESE